MQTISTELTLEEQAGQLVWLDRPGNLRITDGYFRVTDAPVPVVVWRSRKGAHEERFCNLDDVCKFKPRD